MFVSRFEVLAWPSYLKQDLNLVYINKINVLQVPLKPATELLQNRINYSY